MSNQTFTFTREQLTQVLEGAINLYVEYIDQHERDEEIAALCAVSETIEGLSVTDDELNDIGQEDLK
jgi:hypothetical protein